MFEDKEWSKELKQLASNLVLDGLNRGNRNIKVIMSKVVALIDLRILRSWA